MKIIKSALSKRQFSSKSSAPAPQVETIDRRRLFFIHALFTLSVSEAWSAPAKSEATRQPASISPTVFPLLPSLLVLEDSSFVFPPTKRSREAVSRRLPI